MSALRVVFFGTAEIACASLEALAARPEFQILAVVTQPDKPRGRDLRTQPTAVKSAALRLGIAVMQPTRARESGFIDEIRALRPDVGVVVAYGQILPQSLLDIPRLGFLNVHTSLLPRHRGAAPIHWAILSGDPVTGVTIMKMDAGLDTGPILSTATTPVQPQETAQTLHDRLAMMGADLLVQTIPPFSRGDIQPRVQGEGSTYARKIEKADGLIHWNEPADLIERKIRAFNPWPGAFAYFEIGGKAKLVKIWHAEVTPASAPPGALITSDRSALIVGCAGKSLKILELQLEGRKRMHVEEFLAGHTVSKALPNGAAAPPAS